LPRIHPHHSLYWNLRAGDAALAALASAPCAATLQRLNLSGCKAVTDAGAASVARRVHAPHGCHATSRNL
jgi:hypothetical protein